MGKLPAMQGLYDPQYEHDACGVGFVVNIDGTKSHAIIENGLKVLENLVHRGAIGGDMKTGDGAGILFQIPDALFRRDCKQLKIGLPQPGSYGVGMVFMPQSKKSREKCIQFLENIVTTEGLGFLGWRPVTVDSNAIDGQSREEQPVIMQCLVDGNGHENAALERKLYIIRRIAERRATELIDANDIFYIPSMSCRTIVYKGLFTATQLPGFYQDLNDPELTSALAVVHQRYSTNTFPSWELAQPFRYLAHNGEINTLRGNLNLIRSREPSLKSDLFGNDLNKIFPVIDETGSDSSCLDNALELLVNGNRSLSHSMLMLVPEAWGDKYPIGPDERGFFEYHAGLMEPWDGPAAIAFSNGFQVGAIQKYGCCSYSSP